MTKEELLKVKQEVDILFEQASKIEMEDETPVDVPVDEKPEVSVDEKPEVPVKDNYNMDSFKSLLIDNVKEDGNYKVSLKLKDGKYEWEKITNSEVEMSAQKEVDNEVIALQSQLKEQLEKMEKQDKAIVELAKANDKPKFKDAPDKEEVEDKEDVMLSNVAYMKSMRNR